VFRPKLLAQAKHGVLNTGKLEARGSPVTGSNQPVFHRSRLGLKLEILALGRSLRPWSRLKSPPWFWQLDGTSAAVHEADEFEISLSLAAPPRNGSQCAPVWNDHTPL